MLKTIMQIISFSSDSFYSDSKRIKYLVLYRLIVVSLLLAVTAGIFAYWLEMRIVGSEVGDMAIEQARKTIHRSLPLIQNPTETNRSLLESNLKKELSEGGFVLIEIYSSAKDEIADAALQGIELIDRQAANHGKEQLKNGKTNFRNFIVGGEHYVQVFTVLRTDAAVDVGYFEGLYKVPEQEWEQIIKRVYHTVWFVAFGVLVTTAILYPVILRLIRGLLKYSAELTEANIGMLVSMGAAIAKRDCDTDAHNYRVTILSTTLAEALGLEAEEIRKLIVGSFLHDVGKIAITDAVLLKPGRLNEDEWKIMRTHVIHGLDVVKEHTWLSQAVPVVHCHHEKYDGTGYPQGLVGEAIPLGARIFALADVFDALFSKRPYKEPYPFEQCMEIIMAGRGNHFDPVLTDLFVGVVQDFVTIDGLDETDVLRPILARYIDKYFSVELNVL